MKQIIETRFHTKNLIPIIIISFFTILGSYILFQSHAATPYNSQEAESGTLTSLATKQSDLKASGGSYVQFGSKSLLQPSIPTGTSIYLGAQVNPSTNSNLLQPNSCYNSSNATSTLECDIGHSLAMSHSYNGFISPLPITTIQANDTKGTVTLLDWGCKNLATDTSAQLAIDNTQIKIWADQLKSYGKPIFLRWCWEMNLPSKTISANDYVTTWKDIYNIFKGSSGEGATNVAFVWCQSIDAANPSPPFYPGDSYVDWVATDGYDRQQNGLIAFSSVFAGWYSYWSNTETDSTGSLITQGTKPLMIGETGGIAPIPTENAGSYGLQVGSDQEAYIKGAEQALDPNANGNNGKSQYPEIKAFVYFDAAGPYGDWSLTNGTLSSGGVAVNGLSSFITMAGNHYFGYTNTNP
jgi:hypothetical protein